MNPEKQTKKDPPAEVKKQNQDLPNIPASSEKIHSGDKVNKEIKEGSKLHKDGKTESQDQNEN